MPRVAAPCSWHQRAKPRWGRTPSCRPPGAGKAMTRPAAPLASSKNLPQRLRAAAVAAARRGPPSRLAGLPTPRRMPWVAAPGRPPPRRWSGRTVAAPSMHAALGSTGSGALSCTVGAGCATCLPARCACAFTSRATNASASRPSTPPAAGQSAAPIGVGHFLAGPAPGPPPGTQSRRGVNTSAPRRWPRCAAALTRGTAPQRRATGRPSTPRKALPQRAPARAWCPPPRRSPPLWRTTTIPQQR